MLAESTLKPKISSAATDVVQPVNVSFLLILADDNVGFALAAMVLLTVGRFEP